ncbi:glucosaminidase domain-containing protein [Thalassotalea sediminis]|uniref:glucosaminidase domain-containing protein n=1 Tax=Thalassotalea sediminis TaxID=1759089 RepID=UPI002574368C|nr:glucosaminidase domain-containing protein [Thalassotalea sediminis]
MRYVKHYVLSALWLIVLWALIKPLLEQDKYKVEQVSPETKKPLEKTLEEQPLHNVALPDFENFRNIKHKKTAFFKFIKPAVERENKRLSELRNTLLQWQDSITFNKALSRQNALKVEALALKYKLNTRLSIADKIDILLTRVDIVPTPLVLVQAANESAWGTSRFARIGLNFFGIWCYRKGCGMVPSSRDEGLKHEVAAFQSVEQAVAHYMLNINTNAAYKVLRNIRAQLREQKLPVKSDILVTGLLPYSERGSDYILEISEMLRHNKNYIH